MNPKLIGTENKKVRVFKDINPYIDGKGEMLHIMCGDNTFESESGHRLVGLCLDKEDNIIKQWFGNGECDYEVIQDMSKKEIIEKVLKENKISFKELVEIYNC